MDYINKVNTGVTNHKDYRGAFHLRAHNLGAGGVYGSSCGGFTITNPMSDKRKAQHNIRMYRAIGK